jgi:DNA-directed RNA polymerase subunit N (RpoN/RPB10)
MMERCLKCDSEEVATADAESIYVRVYRCFSCGETYWFLNGELRAHRKQIDDVAWALDDLGTRGCLVVLSWERVSV